MLANVRCQVQILIIFALKQFFLCFFFQNFENLKMKCSLFHQIISIRNFLFEKRKCNFFRLFIIFFYLIRLKIIFLQIQIAVFFITCY